MEGHSKRFEQLEESANKAVRRLARALHSVYPPGSFVGVFVNNHNQKIPSKAVVSYDRSDLIGHLRVKMVAAKPGSKLAIRDVHFHNVVVWDELYERT